MGDLFLGVPTPGSGAAYMGSLVLPLNGGRLARDGRCPLYQRAAPDCTNGPNVSPVTRYP
jgi:hypothetical protein